MKLATLSFLILVCVGDIVSPTTITPPPPPTTDSLFHHHHHHQSPTTGVTLPWSLLYVAMVMLLSTSLLHFILFVHALLYLIRTCSSPSSHNDDTGRMKWGCQVMRSKRDKTRNVLDTQTLPDAGNPTCLQKRGKRRSVHFEGEGGDGLENMKANSYRHSTVWTGKCSMSIDKPVCCAKPRRCSVPADYAAFRRLDVVTKSPSSGNNNKGNQRMHHSDSQLHRLVPTITVVPPPESDTDTQQKTPTEVVRIPPRQQRLSMLTLHKNQRTFKAQESKGGEERKEHNILDNRPAGSAIDNNSSDADNNENLRVSPCNASPVAPSYTKMEPVEARSQPTVSFATEQRDSMESFSNVRPLTPDLALTDQHQLNLECRGDDGKRRHSGSHDLHHRTSIEVSVPEELNPGRNIHDFVDSCEAEDHTLEMWEVPKRSSGSMGCDNGGGGGGGSSFNNPTTCLIRSHLQRRTAPPHQRLQFHRYTTYEAMGEVCSPRSPRVQQKRFSVWTEPWDGQEGVRVECPETTV